MKENLSKVTKSRFKKIKIILKITIKIKKTIQVLLFIVLNVQERFR